MYSSFLSVGFFVCLFVLVSGLFVCFLLMCGIFCGKNCLRMFYKNVSVLVLK